MKHEFRLRSTFLATIDGRFTANSRIGRGSLRKHYGSLRKIDLSVHFHVNHQISTPRFYRSTPSAYKKGKHGAHAGQMHRINRFTCGPSMHACGSLQGFLAILARALNSKMGALGLAVDPAR